MHVLENAAVFRQSEKSPLMFRRRPLRELMSCFSMTSPADPSSYEEFDRGQNVPSDSHRTLGTFSGVFSPVTLSMFSALIFLRVGYLIGNAGLFVTLQQFAISYVILLFTVLSVCAISTNGAVEGGGAYCFLVKEGILPDGNLYRLLYCTLLNTFNLIICLFGSSIFAKTNILVFITVLVTICSVIISFIVNGSMSIPIPYTNKLVQNATHPVSGAYSGLSFDTLEANTISNYSRDYTTEPATQTDYASVFGVLFSGVTGILAGANMSGELKDPGRNIPIGTLSAVLFTLIVYVTLSIFSAASCSRFLLQNHFLFMLSVNFWPLLVAVGVITATLSASLSNLIGSSRVLEALAKDKIFGSVFDWILRLKWGSNPVGAVFFSWFLVQIILLIGAMNSIAQLNTVLFLLSYFAINLACLGLELASAPNFRPSFKYFTWHTSLLGLLGSLIMMFVTNAAIAACSIVLCMILVIFLHFFSPSKQMAQWGHISQALIFHQVRKYLLMLDSRKDHVKFWRPQILLLVSNPRFSCPLIDFINDLKKGGLYVLGHVKVIDDVDQVMDEDEDDIDPALKEYTDWLTLVDHLRVKAFVELTVARNVRDGFQHLVRISGIGAMKPNTIVLGFQDSHTVYNFLHSTDSPYYMHDNHMFPAPRELSHLDAFQYVSMIEDTLRMNKNICLCRNFQKLNKNSVARNPNIRFIDVWPINFFEPTVNDMFDTSSLFMMQLACIVNMVPKWKRLQLRICFCDCTNSTSFTANETNVTLKSKLENLLSTLRIGATIFSVPDWGNVIETLNGSAINFTKAPCDDYDKDCSDDANLAYLQGVNTLIQHNSNQTAVTFIYLPRVPKVTQRSNKIAKRHLYEQYLHKLTRISESLPPTILVRGVSTVTSTDL